MTLDQLVALDAIVAAGTFRGAADRLSKAQSAVSHQIRKLEDALSSMKSLLREAQEKGQGPRNRPSSSRPGSGSYRGSAGTRVREFQTKCQVAEVERDRLTEYVQVKLLLQLCFFLSRGQARGLQ